MEKTDERLSYRVGSPDEIKGLQGFNFKPRSVYCQKCKYQIVTDLAGAKCIECDSMLIELVIHNELAGSDS